MQITVIIAEIPDNTYYNLIKMIKCIFINQNIVIDLVIRGKMTIIMCVISLDFWVTCWKQSLSHIVNLTPDFP